MGAPSRQSNRGTTEKINRSWRCGNGGDANRLCGITYENAENKRLSLVEAEMEKLMHQDEQELLSVWEG